MEDLPNEIIYNIALDMNLKDILNSCLTSKKFYNIICDNENFWVTKLKRDFNILHDANISSAKEYYRNLLLRIKEAKKEYFALVQISETFKNISNGQFLKFPNGMKFYRQDISNLFYKWKDDFADVLKILGEQKVSDLQANIEKLMVYKSKYKNQSKNYFIVSSKN